MCLLCRFYPDLHLERDLNGRILVFLYFNSFCLLSPRPQPSRDTYIIKFCPVLSSDAPAFYPKKDKQFNSIGQVETTEINHLILLLTMFKMLAQVSSNIISKLTKSVVKRDELQQT